MHDINALGAKVEELRSEILALAETPELDDAQEARWAAANVEFDEAKAAFDAAEARAARVASVRETVVPQVTVERSAAPAVIIRNNPQDVLGERTGASSEREYRRKVVDATLRSMEGLIEDGDNQAHFESVLKRHALSQKRGDVEWAENLLQRSSEDYREAFAKAMMGRTDLLTNEERTALSTGTSANGGYLLPTHLDPTIILTNSGAGGNDIRSISRVVTLTEGDTWHGVSSAGVTASYDGELVEVSDDSPTFGNPSVKAWKAQSFVQASIEAFQDISGLSSDVLMMFADARDRLESSKFTTGAGDGSKEPTGIFTALDANTNVEVTSATAATIALADIHGLYAAVPKRFRSRSSWLMNPTYNLAIKALGAAVSASYTNDLTQAPVDRLLGRPVYESDDAPSTQTTTVRDNEVILGDFSNFVIVDKPGSMSVEFIPHLFNTTTNLPDGRRGWYAYWRSGSDSVNDLAFRLLQDKTSA